MTDLTDNVTEVIKIIVDATSDAVVKKMKPVVEKMTCEDAISRQAVLDIFGLVMDYWKEHAIDVEPHEIEDALIKQYEFTAKQLSELPPVTPTQKIGHWTNGDSICPCCKEDKFKDLDADIWADWQPKYCPNCGAKMESEVNDADSN